MMHAYPLLGDVSLDFKHSYEDALHILTKFLSKILGHFVTFGMGEIPPITIW